MNLRIRGEDARNLPGSVDVTLPDLNEDITVKKLYSNEDFLRQINAQWGDKLGLTLSNSEGNTFADHLILVYAGVSLYDNLDNTLRSLGDPGRAADYRILLRA